MRRFVPIRRRKAVPFRPNQVPGLQLWLRADQGLTLDGSNNVSTWTDVGPFGRQLTQGTATQRPAGTGTTLNGRPVVRFDGVDDRLALAAQNLPGNWGITNAFSIFYVRRCNTGTGTLRPFIYWAGAAVTNEFTVWDAFSDDNLYCDCGDTGAGGRVNAVADPGTGWRRTALVRNGSAFNSWREGTALFSGTYSDALDSASATFNLGDIGGGVASMDLAELLIYSVALSALQRGRVETWLRNRWGV